MFRVFNFSKQIRVILFTAVIILSIYVIYIYYNLSVEVFKPNKLLPIYCVDRGDKKVALTFDAAWGNDDTKDLLKILEKYNAKATFFLVGFWVDKFPDDVKLIHQKGHEIGSHSNKHLHMSRLSEQEIIQDINSCEEKIINIIGKKPIVFRAPFGDYNNLLISTLNRLGYYVIQWDVDSLDWKNLSANEITIRVLSKVKSGSIILFHNNAPNTKYALEDILRNLKNQGYSFVTVSELIYKKDFYIDHNGTQKVIND